MQLSEILRTVDHTLLNPIATWDEIRQICEDGLRFHTASVCIPASYVRQAREFAGESLPVCTVIGFPNGYDTTAAKVFQAQDALKNGADEIDMVIHLGWPKDREWSAVLEEIQKVKEEGGKNMWKEIVETCL